MIWPQINVARLAQRIPAVRIALGPAKSRYVCGVAVGIAPNRLAGRHASGSSFVVSDSETV